MIRLALLPVALLSCSAAGKNPVLLGRDHWPGVIDTATGDSGAREYLTAHPPLLVECGDIGSGEDVDRPPRG